MPGDKPRFKVKTGEFEFSFTKEQVEAANLVKRSSTEFNLLHNNRSVNAAIVEQDINNKRITIKIEGEKFAVEIQDDLDQMLDNMGFRTAVNRQVKHIKAPMPGLVLQIAVSEGQQVKEGENVLILGAMKMENSISLPSDAIIKRIAVTEGQAVEKGQVLVELG